MLHSFHGTYSHFNSELCFPSEFLSPTQACAFLKAACINVYPTDCSDTGGPARSPCTWWSNACAVAKRTKNRALTRYRHHLGDLSLWIAFKKARAAFRNPVACKGCQLVGFLLHYRWSYWQLPGLAADPCSLRPLVLADCYSAC